MVKREGCVCVSDGQKRDVCDRGARKDRQVPTRSQRVGMLFQPGRGVSHHSPGSTKKAKQDQICLEGSMVGASLVGGM